jgi:hypothetical protein
MNQRRFALLLASVLFYCFPFSLLYRRGSPMGPKRHGPGSLPAHSAAIGDDSAEGEYRRARLAQQACIDNQTAVITALPQ